MLLLPPLTALFLTLLPSGSLTPWQLPSHLLQGIELPLSVGVPIISSLSHLRRLEEPRMEFAVRHHSAPHPFSAPSTSSPSTSAPSTSSPPAITSASSYSTPPAPLLPPNTSSFSYDCSFRPSAPLGRVSSDSISYSSASTSFSSAGLDAGNWQFYYPWLGYLYIYAPGFGDIEQPYDSEGFFDRLPVLPLSFTLSEPSYSIYQDSDQIVNYQNGSVTWISLIRMSSVLPCHHTH